MKFSGFGVYGKPPEPYSINNGSPSPSVSLVADWPPTAHAVVQAANVGWGGDRWSELHGIELNVQQRVPDRTEIEAPADLPTELLSERNLLSGAGAGAGGVGHREVGWAGV
jgi:hypothetical protein